MGMYFDTLKSEALYIMPVVLFSAYPIFCITGSSILVCSDTSAGMKMSSICDFHELPELYITDMPCKPVSPKFG